MRVVVALFLLAGCDGVFGLVGVSASDGGASSDAGAVPTCTSYQLRDTFDDASAICPWGGAFEEASLSIADSALAIAITGDRTYSAGCTAYLQYAFTTNGVIASVPKPLASDFAYTLLTVRSQPGEPDLEVSLAVADGHLTLNDGPSPVAMFPGSPPPWWRLRRDSDTRVRADVSNDGVTWMSFGAVTLPAVAELIAVDIDAGISNSPSQADTAEFGELTICD